MRGAGRKVRRAEMRNAYILVGKPDRKREMGLKEIIYERSDWIDLA
jgi:hypothetical protein